VKLGIIMDVEASRAIRQAGDAPIIQRPLVSCGRDHA
jgi:hypothetical protein